MSKKNVVIESKPIHKRGKSFSINLYRTKKNTFFFHKSKKTQYFTLIMSVVAARETDVQIQMVHVSIREKQK